MSFWSGFAGGLQAGATVRNGWDERGFGLFGQQDRAAEAAAPASGEDATARAPQSSSRGDDAAAEGGAAPAAGGGAPLDLSQFMRRTRQVESGGDDRAQAQTSSATGRYQFIDSTWRSMMQQHPELNLTWSGRFDPTQQERAMRQFTQNNAAVLQRHGLPITNSNLYAMHFFGEGDGPRVIRAAPGTPLSEIVNPRSIQANRFLSGRTAGWARDWTTRKVGGETVVARGATRQTASGDAEEGPEPIRVRPGELSIQPMFNAVPADAGQRIAGSAEMDELIAGAGGAGGARAANAPLIDGRYLPDATATARGGVATIPGGAAAAGADVAPLVDGRNLPEGGAPPVPISSDTFPPPAGSARAQAGVAQVPGARAAVQAVVPARPAAAVAAPAAPPAAVAATTAPVPQPRPADTPAAPAPATAPTRRAPGITPAASTLSERDRLMLLRDEGSLPPGEAERLRAGLPSSFGLADLFRGRRAEAPRQMSAPIPQPRPAQAPAAAPADVPAAGPATTGSTPAAPAAAPPADPHAAPSGAVQERDQPAEFPAQPLAQNEADRFSDIRARAQAALDRGDNPRRVAQRLAAAGIPVEQWPEAIRPAPQRGVGLAIAAPAR